MSATHSTPSSPSTTTRPLRPGGPAPTVEKQSSWPIVMALLIVLATAAGLTAVIIRAAHRHNDYAQASPDDLVKSAVGMIRNGEASRLVELFHPETPEANAILKRVGELLGSMQALGSAVAKRFPADVAKLRDEAMKKAQEATQANAGSIVAAIQNRQRRPGPGGGMMGQPGGGPPSEADQRGFEDFAKALFADPFGWIDRNADRLSAVTISDDQAAVMFDGKPLPPAGLLLKNVKGRWYIDVPTNVPGVAQFLPQTRHEYSILGSLIKVLDNVIRELADDVSTGKVGRVEQLAEKAGEKAFGPAAMVFIVYGKEMDVRGRRDKVMTDYKKKLDAWVDQRGTLKDQLGADWFVKLTDAMEKLTVEEVDRLLRLDSARTKRDEPRQTPSFKDMDVAQFEAKLESWLLQRGTKVRLSSTSRSDVEEVVQAATGVKKKGK